MKSYLPGVICEGGLCGPPYLSGLLIKDSIPENAFHTQHSVPGVCYHCQDFASPHPTCTVVLPIISHTVTLLLNLHGTGTSYFFCKWVSNIYHKQKVFLKNAIY